MNPEWYYEIDGEEYGPVTAVRLKELAGGGKLQADHLIWKEGMQKKVPAKTVKGLFEGGGQQTATATAEPPRAKQKTVTKPAQKQDDDVVETEVVEEEEELVETLEAEEEVKPKKGKKEREEEEEPDEPPEIVAEVPAVYRDGHPKLDGPITGMLIVESSGLCFSFEEEEETEEVRIPFAKIDNILEPAKGDFPPELKSKAFKSKVAGKAGQLASGLLGKWMGGTAGDVTAKLGSTASKMASEGSDLGKPPRNRLTIFAQLKKGRCKIYIDVSGDSRDEMNDEAKALYKTIQKARDKWSTKEKEPPPPPQGNVNIVAVSGVVNSAGAPAARAGNPGMAPAPAIAGKPFRILASGKLAGPFSLDEIRNLLAAGKVGGADMIGVETWLPVSTLSGLLRGGAGGPGAAAAAAAGKAAQEDEEEEDEDEVESEADDEEEKSSSSDDGDSIPMDDEFNID